MSDRPGDGSRPTEHRRPVDPGPLRTVGVLARSAHPGPAVAITVIVTVLAIGVGLEPWRVVVLALAIAANQASIGLSNDWIDADRDRAVGRTDKPVAAGLVSVSTVRTAAVASALLSIVLTLPLGWAAALAHLVFLGSGWAYNAGLKSSVLSVLPYLIGFGTLPSIVGLALPDPTAASGWASGLAAALGVAAHFANVLPDLEDDRATGVRGLPHILGRVGSGAAICLVLVAGALLGFFGPAGASTVVQWVGLVGTVVLAGLIAVLLTRTPTRLLFQLIIAAALLNVVVLAVSGDRILT